jgi:hypothetical protein
MTRLRSWLLRASHASCSEAHHYFMTEPVRKQQILVCDVPNAATNLRFRTTYKN